MLGFGYAYFWSVSTIIYLLLRRDVELIDDQSVPYYQDLYDHLVRVLDQLDLYRDLVAAVLEANLSVTSNNLNAVSATSDARRFTKSRCRGWRRGCARQESSVS